MTGRLFQPRKEDLPQEVPVFPLSGALLLPGGHLPLNIFEPRYLSMTLDALGQGRMFAMVQPRDPESEEDSPALYSVACLGRITAFAETDDGRLEITLLGLTRFHLGAELALLNGYRRVTADYSAFVADLDPVPRSLFGEDREAFLTVLRAYAGAIGLSFDWKVIAEIPDAALVTSLAMACPFEPREKQALLEAPTPVERARLLASLLEIGAASPPDSARPQ